ncbi:MAG: hypothetical protein RI841_13675 [Halomonas sp.]|uniref:hypothetical protein n=1 Tax=Halomonas sp. TaxID=1486246 RepID=UPI0028702BB6|nr:hypothetical protein [Halomonas sp.]MDR9440524.1 hypothetical protein [Halomonas sp.]
MLEPHLPTMANTWTAETVLPDGNIGDQASFEEQLLETYPFLDAVQARRYAAPTAPCAEHS